MASEETKAANAKTDVSVTLHWLEQSRSQRVLWMLEELNLPYKLTTHKRSSTGLAMGDLKEIHPLGKSPVMTIEAPGGHKEVLAESGVIVEFLAEHFGRELIPKQYKDGMEGKVGGETEQWQRYRYFMHYAEGSLMIILLLKLFTTRIKEAPVPFFIKPITKRVGGNIDDLFVDQNLETHFSFVESQLASVPAGADGKPGDFLCGDKLTGADIMMSYPLEAAQARGGLTKDRFPKTIAYVERLRMRDANKKAVEKIKADFGKYEATPP